MARKKQQVDTTTFMESILDNFGDNYIAEKKEIEFIPTGSLSLDCSIGGRGIPKGMFTEIYGPEGTAKTGLSLNLCKKAIQQGGKAVYIDVENMLDISYAHKIVGVENGERFIVIRPKTAEDAFRIAELAINKKEFDLIIFDSIGALAPSKEMEDDFTDSNVALVPRLLSRFLRRNGFAVRDSNVAFVFINQVRDTIGSYVQTYSTPGGHALKHFTSVIISLTKGEKIKYGDDVVGILIPFTIKKDKLGPPSRSHIIPFIFGKGVDEENDVLDFSEMLGVVVKLGSYYKFEDVMLGKGLANSCEFLRNNKEVLDKIVEKVYNHMSKNNIIEESEEVIE